ncbi:MAG: aldo/keto reductase [Oscillospiraceae bacterium]|nr:aldo/keto reductase [Oscillospiraceae bacterium]
MKYGRIAGIDKEISRIIFGTMIIHPDENGSYDRVFSLLDSAMENGITTFDTAKVYGSEPNIGKWMKERDNRSDVVIITKGAHPDENGSRVPAAKLAEDIENSLRQLQTDYIDIYMLHRDDLTVPVSDIMDTLNRYVGSGAIKAIGGSNWTVERFTEANNYALEKGLTPFTASSPNYGLAVQVENPWGDGCISISGPENDVVRKWYVENNMPVFAYSSIARGFFSGRVTSSDYSPDTDKLDDVCKYAYCHPVNFKRLDKAYTLAEKKGVTVAEIAIAYCFAGELDVYALLGAESLLEINSAVKALDVEITPEEAAWLVE